MSNTLTNLTPVIYQAADVVSRELVGMIPSVTLNASADQVAKDQTVRFPVVGSYAADNIAAAATGPDPNATTVGNDTMTISKSRGVTFYWEAEEQMGVALYEQILRDQFAQAMRTLCNEVETDLTALQIDASRAYAADATTPAALFGTDLSESAQVLKILLDNGAPTSDLQLVINTASGAKLRSLGQLTKANEAGSAALREQGVLLDIHGFKIRESAKVVSTTAVGNNTGPYVANGDHAIGATTITLKTGTGTILAGDIITFGSDTATKYVVKTGITEAGDITINGPGLVTALADADAVAVVGTCARNMAFDRGAIQLLARVPAMPAGGDSADDVMVVQDPVSGLAFQIAMYRQRRRIAYEVGLAWGAKATKSAHMALLLGQ